MMHVNPVLDNTVFILSARNSSKLIAGRGISLGREAIMMRAQQDYDPDLVQIDDAVIDLMVCPSGALQPMTISLPYHIASNPLSSFGFLISMTGINYRFWTRLSDGSLSKYSYLGVSGARALWASFEAAWGNGADPIHEFAKNLSHFGFKTLFGDMPDPIGRQMILEEIMAGNQLATLYEEISEDIATLGMVTVSQASRLADVFPKAFTDTYLKKAQLALSMYAAYLQGRGEVVDVGDLTAFADYRVPQVLRAIGVLKYSEKLAAKVDGHMLLAQNSAEEHAIRSGTILACERIAKRFGGSAADVDNLLWQSQEVAGESRFHLIETCWY